MSYLIDTNVISELRKKAPNQAVLEWMGQHQASSLHLSVLSLGELRKGVEIMADLARRAKLLNWLEQDLPLFFRGRILSVDASVADQWGRMLASAGRIVPAIDSLIAATAACHRLCLVTRNARDFLNLPVDVVNPWMV